MALSFELTPNDQPLSDAARNDVLANPGFGKKFTDHMAVAMWREGSGWGEGQVRPYGPFTLDPAAAVLHYAQEIFEGMKAYRHADGSVWTFRPEKNAARFNRSAKRLALPQMDEADFVASLKALVEADVNWVPAFEDGEASLYLRPFMFASEAFLGVRPSLEVTYSVIASPAGPYFSGGLKPVSLWLSRDYARAGVGGTGAAKCGGNYASSLAAQIEASEHGCDQVVFLDSLEQKYIEELGGMNVFLVTNNNELITPELTGTILEGVTRDSILELAKDLGLTPVERRIDIQEWIDGCNDGTITEIFACGTAAVVTPVGRLKFDGGEVASGPADDAGPVATKIRQTLLGIQKGTLEDTRGWMTRLV